MELRLKTPEKYRFPAFETLQWYAAKYHTQKIKELNQKRATISKRLLAGLRYLNNSLRRWINSKDVSYFLLFSMTHGICNLF